MQLSASCSGIKKDTTVESREYKIQVFYIVAQFTMSIPQSTHTVDVHIINTTTTVVCPTDFFMEPPIKGQEYLNLPTYAFLVQNKRTDVSLLFDLGGRKDWWKLAPSTFHGVRNGVKHLEVKKSISEILEEGGVDLNSIKHLVVRSDKAMAALLEFLLTCAIAIPTGIILVGPPHSNCLLQLVIMAC